MRQSNGSGAGVGDKLRVDLAKLRIRVGHRRLPGRVDLAGGADAGEQPEGAEAAREPWAIMPRQSRRDYADLARLVSSSELGIIILMAAALAAISVFMVFINVP